MEREKPNLSLYGLEEELLELLQRRDDVAAEVLTTVEDQAAQTTELQTIDVLIAGYVERQSIAKADSVIAAVRECRMASEALRKEAKRLVERAEAREARAEWIRQIAAERLAAECDPRVIEQAKGHSVLFRVRGRLGEIRLCKSPPAVNIGQPELLPLEMQKRRVTVPENVWRKLCEWAARAGYAEALDLEMAGERSPDIAGIGKKLKDGEAVAGANLVEDKVYLRVG